jgi:membrane-associated protease RseP (regulator of RpoE activity)
MLKTLTLIIAGLAAGFAIAYFSGSADSSSERFGSDSARVSDVSAGSSVSDESRAAVTPGRVAQLESALNAEIEQRAALEQRVADLVAAVEGLREAGAADAPAAPVRAADATGAAQSGAQAGAGRGPRGQETKEERIARLVGAGFSPDRAAWIENRTSELTMQRIQAQYQRRRGESVDPALLDDAAGALRLELGDSEYERYLDALGMPTKVGVFNVIPSSPAEEAGLRAGDEILTYAGTRVFDMRELNNLTLEGATGQPVVLDIERDGQSLQLVMPRGPIGIGGGPFNRRP